MAPQQTDTQPSLPLLDDVKAVLFDVYGTLLISEAGDINFADSRESDDVIHRALTKVGISTTMSVQDLNALYFQTLSKHQDARRIQGIQYPEVDIRSVWYDLVKHISGVEPSREDTEQLATWFEIETNPTDQMPGALELLEQLAESAIHTGLISNAQFYTPITLEILLGKTLEQLEIPSYLTAYSYEFLEGKPGKLMFSSCASFLFKQEGIQPHEILFVGNDCLKDCYPAKSVGFRTALFAGDARSYRPRLDDPRCKNLKPDLVVTDLLQLLECIQVS